MKNKERFALALSIFTFLFLVISFTFSIDISNFLTGMLGFNTSFFDISLCINSPPYFSNTTCLAYYEENETINCSFTVGDLNENSSLLNFTYQIINGTYINFSHNYSNTSFYAQLDASHRGDHLYNLSLKDNSPCGDTTANASWYFYVNRTSNRPPEYYTTIPTIRYPQYSGTYTTSITWSNYFRDPDLDPFTVSIAQQPLNIPASLSGNRLNLITIDAFCGEDSIKFKATDIYNATGYSDSITIKVDCVKPPEPPEPSDPGASQKFPKSTAIPEASSLSCFPEWECGNWSECFPQGFWVRACNDLNLCNSTLFRPNLTEPCNYTPTCFDAYQNGDEKGVDCGGSCNEQCPEPDYCFDGIKNNDEEGIDCGGSCRKCRDPDTCFDGIKNGEEEGIDCGGRCSKKCPEKQTPSSTLAFNWARYSLLGLTLALLGYLARYIGKKKRLIKRFIKKILRFFKKQVFISLEEQLKFFSMLDKLERDLYKKTTRTAMSALSEIISDYTTSLIRIKETLTFEELLNRISESAIDTELKEIIIGIFNDINEIEFSTKLPSMVHIQELIYETKNVVIQTHPEEEGNLYTRGVSFKITAELDRQFDNLIEMNISILKGDYQSAKNRYMEIYKNISRQHIYSKYLNNCMMRAKQMIEYKIENEDLSKK